MLKMFFKLRTSTYISNLIKVVQIKTQQNMTETCNISSHCRYNCFTGK